LEKLGTMGNLTMLDDGVKKPDVLERLKRLLNCDNLIGVKGGKLR